MWAEKYFRRGVSWESIGNQLAVSWKDLSSYTSSRYAVEPGSIDFIDLDFKVKTMDPGSGAYRGDEGNGARISERTRNGSSTMDYLIIFLTEKGALPISERTWNSADTMVYQ